jgi:hypothetical protein
LLFAVYPVFFLYARNSGNLPSAVLVRPLVVAVSFGMLVWSVARWTARDGARGALLATAWILLWSVYGHLHRLLGDGGGFAAWLGQHRILIPVWIAAAAGLSVASRRNGSTTSRVRDLSRVATGIGLVLVAWSASAILTAGSRDEWETGLDPRPGENIRQLTHPEADIYYVVLDGYGRADILRDLYRYDNEPFLEALRARGFCVADSARSNHTQTLLSLVAALGSTDLEGWSLGQDAAGADRRPLVRMLRRFVHHGILPQLCDWTRAFATGYAATEILDVDAYLSPILSLNEFERALVAATPLDVVLNLVESRHGDIVHRRRIEFAFENLPVAADEPPSAFTFAHIIAPHPPFVFAPPEATAGAMVPLADGDHVIGGDGLSVEQYRAAYRAQVAAVNLRVLATVDAILANGRESIIILQGDHGPGSLLRWDERIPEPAAARERLGILLALRLPAAETALCRPGMTPSNLVRELGHQLLGSDVKPRPDRSFFSTWSRPYDFVEITPDGSAVSP